MLCSYINRPFPGVTLSGEDTLSSEDALSTNNSRSGRRQEARLNRGRRTLLYTCNEAYNELQDLIKSVSRK